MTERNEAYLHHGRATLVDNFGIWLSSRSIRRFVPSFAGKRLGDFGCGHRAAFTRTVLGEVASAVVVDVSLDDDLKADPRVRAIVGGLPGALAELETATFDVILLVSVLEHVTEPQQLLREIRRLLAPGGTALVNVPSWRGKRYLELSAFRLGWSPAAEMDDHKTYYDVRDLWPMLVAAGFRPRNIQCFSHKFGLNTFAASRAE